MSSIETYKGVRIHHDDEDGYYALQWLGHGWLSFGYTDTIEELRAEIDDHFAEDRAMLGIDTPLDTPCLDDSFHRMEMDI